ncbi:ArsR/SmtB family transcription factor [Haloechinothrix halophila]|uniref:ArsR/SmtB family transcription factor n=1 Tax=Haloechinothrix halophila TaxID=1069073 RepID=UPI00040B4C97|nr:helix-turn-helix domain-containing protein [Haloechinothrix halophila]
MPQNLDELRALAHPLRLRILSLLTGTAMSAAEVARELGGTQANASYHLRRLHDVGLLDMLDEVQVRGGWAKRYRHNPESGERFAERNAEQERLLTTALTDELRRRSEYRASGRPSTTTDAELWLDPQSWSEIVTKAMELSRDLHAAALPPRTPDAIKVSVTISMFSMIAD